MIVRKATLKLYKSVIQSMDFIIPSEWGISEMLRSSTWQTGQGSRKVDNHFIQLLAIKMKNNKSNKNKSKK